MEMKISLEQLLDSTANCEIVENLAGQNRMTVKDFCEKNGLKRYRVTKRERYFCERGMRYNYFHFFLYAPDKAWIHRHHNSQNGVPVVQIEELPL